MGTITITSEVQAVLGQLKDKTELRDADGNMIGIFTPAEAAEAELYEKAKKMVDPDLIESRKKEEGFFPFEEVKKQLKATETAT